MSYIASGTDSALLMLHRAGQRIKPQHSMHGPVKDIGPHECHWRVIVCGPNDWEEFACDFDDEYS